MTEIIERNTPIPCTGCGYCTHGCPKNIAIPQYFALFNKHRAHDRQLLQPRGVLPQHRPAATGKASDCIGCGQCEQACPQHLPIREYLKEVAEKFEAGASFPTRK